MNEPFSLSLRIIMSAQDVERTALIIIINVISLIIVDYVHNFTFAKW